LDNREVKIEIESTIAPQLLGKLFEDNQQLLEANLELKIFTRGNELILSGASNAVERGLELCRILSDQLLKGFQPGTAEINYLVELAKKQ